MRFHADMNLCPPIENSDLTGEMIRKSAELGYDAVGISFPSRLNQREIHEVGRVCKSFGVDLVTRIDLAPKKAGDLLRDLRRLRRRIEVIAVQCYSKQVARQAAKDRRVDLISFPATDTRKRFFDSAEAELASGALASLEVVVAPLLYLRGFRRIRLLSALRKETLIAVRSGVPIVLSSGADDVDLLRKPEDYAFLSYLFGLEFPEAKKALSENPQAIIERNRRKLSSDYVAPGVYIVRRGKDCPSK
jgi:RNase P/RNase MRP subunit p30